MNLPFSNSLARACLSKLGPYQAHQRHPLGDPAGYTIVINKRSGPNGVFRVVIGKDLEYVLHSCLATWLEQT